MPGYGWSDQILSPSTYSSMMSSLLAASNGRVHQKLIVAEESPNVTVCWSQAFSAIGFSDPNEANQDPEWASAAEP